MAQFDVFLQLLIFCSGLVGFVAACPPPLNDFYYLGNDTHTTADLIRGLVDQQSPGDSEGWSEIISKTGKPRTPWPGGDISYCFGEPLDRWEYADDLHEAWDLWAERMDEPGQASGYQLTFHEFNFGADDWPYCYLPRKSVTDRFVWNPKVSADVLLIEEKSVRIPGASISSTVGYVPVDWPSPGAKEGRHRIHFYSGVKDNWANRAYWIASIAHELGHVFGFWHEHQRPDRDHYVRFNCAALPGYDKAKRRVGQRGRYRMEQVCEDGMLAAIYNFGVIFQFDKIDHRDVAGRVDGRYWYLHQNFANPYDEHSIMHYDSNARNWDDGPEKLDVVLAYWKERGPDFVPPSKFDEHDVEYVRRAIMPSDQDIDGLKKMYPWRQQSPEHESGSIVEG